MPGTGGFWQCCLQPGNRWNWNGLPKGWEWTRLPCARHWNGCRGRLREAGLPFELLELEENVQLATAEEYGDLIRSVLSQKRSTPLSQSAMEVLAIIAYNQPVTRAFVEQIRGVDSSSAVNSLVVRDLVEEAGRLELPDAPSPTGPLPISCGASGCRAWMSCPTSPRRPRHRSSWSSSP